MIAAAFLLMMLWVLIGVSVGLARLIENGLHRVVDVRHAFLLVALAFAAVMTRGQTFEWAAWPPMIIASLLTFRYVRAINARTRARRLLGRAVPHT